MMIRILTFISKYTDVKLKKLTYVFRRFTMKEFNSEKFCRDLVSLRGKESQDIFSKKLGIKRSTLSLLENGKQVPTIDMLM